jgi:hypothetical protein
MPNPIDIYELGKSWAFKKFIFKNIKQYKNKYFIDFILVLKIFYQPGTYKRI